MAGALAEVFPGQFSLLGVEVSVEPFADGAGPGLHPLDRGVVDEVRMRKYNQTR
jgi:DNA adenine methylase